MSTNSEEYRIQNKLVGCPIGVPISYYFVYQMTVLEMISFLVRTHHFDKEHCTGTDVIIRFNHEYEVFNLYYSLKPLSHWTATVLRQLATDIASRSQSSLETVARYS